MQQFSVGDRIEHIEFSGYSMQVLEVGTCAEPGSDEPAYKVIDPDGAADWLCGREVRAAG